MPDAETSNQFQPMEASTTSNNPIILPNLPCGAALRRSFIGRVGPRYALWLMQQRARYEGPQMHLMPGHYIRGPRMRGGLMRQHMHLMGEPHVMRGGLMREHMPLMGEPHVMRGGLMREHMPLMGEPHVMRGGLMREPQEPLINVQGGRGMEPPRGIQRRGVGSRSMEPPGIAPRGMEPREIEKKDMEPPRGMKRRSKRSQGMEPQVIAPGGMEPPKGKRPRGSKATCKNTRGKKN